MSVGQAIASLRGSAQGSSGLPASKGARSLRGRRGFEGLLSAAKLSDKHPLTPAPLPQRGEGRVKWSLCPRPLGGEGGSQPAFSSAGASRVRGFIRHCIMQRSVVRVRPDIPAGLPRNCRPFQASLRRRDEHHHCSGSEEGPSALRPSPPPNPLSSQAPRRSLHGDHPDEVHAEPLALFDNLPVHTPLFPKRQAEVKARNVVVRVQAEPVAFVLLLVGGVLLTCIILFPSNSSFVGSAIWTVLLSPP